MLEKIAIETLQMNPATKFGLEWAALVSGSADGPHDAMTISWGQMGSLWERRGEGTPHRGLSTVTVFVRPQRYTHELMEHGDHFSICFLGEGHRRELGYLGAKSGRDGDKLEHLKLTAIELDGACAIAESELVLTCKKLYAAPLVEGGFVDRRLIDDNYPQRDFHTVYVGEVLGVWKQV